MQHFSMGALRDWSPVAIGEVLGFDIPETGHRTISFEVVSNAHVSIMAFTGGDPGEEWLVGAGEGTTTVKFTVSENVGVTFHGDPATVVYIRTFIKTQVLAETDDPTYTSIEPRPSGPTEDMRRMMRMVQINNQQREAHLQAELAAMRAQIEARPSPAAPVVEESPSSPQPQPDGDE